MLRLSTIVPLFLALSAGPVSAQVPGVVPPSPAEALGLMEMARQAMNPAAQALAHRAELELTPAQVATLDSLAAPMNRLLEETMAGQGSSAMTAVNQAMINPSAEIDEAAVRAAFREQADRQADMVILRMRLDRSVAQVLTPAQREKAEALQMNSMFGMMRAMGGAVTPDR
jgi:Spy/CpxP family protein refolding chaperone